MSFDRFHAAVFDMDGVLLDSEPAHHAVLNEALSAEGKQLTFDEYRPYIGTTLEYTWSDIIHRFNLAGPIEHYIADYDRRILAHYKAHSTINPGAREMLETLAGHGLRLAVASSSRTDWVEACLEALGVRSYFEAVVTGDMVTHSKPDPEIYLLAASRLGVQPEHCLAVEDAPKGVAAAVAAGMTVIGVRTSYTSHLTLEGAAVVLDALTAFRTDLPALA